MYCGDDGGGLISSGKALFFSLDGSYLALTNVAVDPIIIPSDIDVEMPVEVGLRLPSRHTYSHVYYYADEDGEKIVRERIEKADDDLRYFIEKHKMISFFMIDIEEAAEIGQTFVLNKTVEELVSSVREYVSFVGEHQEEQGLNSFLGYPACLPGHYSQRGDSVAKLMFNEGQTKDNALRDLSVLEEILEAFKCNPVFPEKVKICPGQNGSLDTSYRSCVRLTKYYLERLGFKVE